MPRRRLLLPLIALLGCQADQPTAPAVDMFAPTGMRIHPIFTQRVEINHTGKPDGIEAQLEFQDQFGDPTKAAGRVLFELFDYIKNSPDPRGARVAGPWVGSLQTLDEQHARWNTTLRTYRFQLAYPAIQSDRAYVLTAIFELSSGGRFFDRIVMVETTNPKDKKEGHGGTGLFPSLDNPPGPSNTPTTRSSPP